MGPNLGEPYVTHICVECETSFTNSTCWMCGDVGIPSLYANTDVRMAFSMANQYTEEYRGSAVEE